MQSKYQGTIETNKGKKFLENEEKEMEKVRKETKKVEVKAIKRTQKTRSAPYTQMIMTVDAFMVSIL